METNKIKNLFSKIPLSDLYLETAQLIQFPVDTLNTEAIRSLLSQSKLSEYICLILDRKLIIKSEDLYRILSRTDSIHTFLRDPMGFYEQMGYLVLQIDELKSYEPPSGYLYNICKKNSPLPVLILDRYENCIGVTDFEYVVNRTKLKLQDYF